MPTTEQLVDALTACESTIRARFTRRLSMVSSRVDVDDLIGEVSYKLFRSLDTCQATTDDELRHWILQTAKWTAETMITGHRASKRSTAREHVAIGVATDDSRDGYQPSLNDDPCEVAQANETLASVMAVIDGLRPMQAACVKASYLHGRDYADIADEFGISHEAVKQHVKRGLAAVREILV